MFRIKLFNPFLHTKLHVLATERLDGYNANPADVWFSSRLTLHYPDQILVEVGGILLTLVEPLVVLNSKHPISDVPFGSEF